MQPSRLQCFLARYRRYGAGAILRIVRKSLVLEAARLGQLSTDRIVPSVWHQRTKLVRETEHHQHRYHIRATFPESA